MYSRSDQQELVVALVFRLSSQGVVHGDLQSFHGLDELRGHVGVCLSDLPSSHELFDCSNDCFLVFLRRGIRLDHSSVSIPDHKDGLFHTIVVLIDLLIVNIVKGDQVPKLRELLLECPSESSTMLHLCTNTRFTIWILETMCQKMIFKAPLLLNRGSPSSSSTSMTSSSSSPLATSSSISTSCSKS